MFTTEGLAPPFNCVMVIDITRCKHTHTHTDNIYQSVNSKPVIMAGGTNTPKPQGKDLYTGKSIATNTLSHTTVPLPSTNYGINM